MVKSRKVCDWKVCCHQWPTAPAKKKMDLGADQSMKVP